MATARLCRWGGGQPRLAVWLAGLGAFIIALGLIFAVWVIVLGVAALLLAIIGWLFEYYRGEFAR